MHGFGGMEAPRWTLFFLSFFLSFFFSFLIVQRTTYRRRSHKTWHDNISCILFLALLGCDLGPGTIWPNCDLNNIT